MLTVTDKDGGRMTLDRGPDNDELIYISLRTDGRYPGVAITQAQFNELVAHNTELHKDDA